MFRKILSNLFRANAAQSPEPEAAVGKEPRFKLNNSFYFEFDEVSNGYGGYRKANVYLLKMDDPTFRRCIVDQEGRIQNFPGFADGDWKKSMEFPLDNKVRFAFWISGYQEGKARVSWTLQPDGRYFEDEDGFGAENCEEICLYSCLDENGRFTEPFSWKG